jgi:hypothetical protein
MPAGPPPAPPIQAAPHPLPRQAATSRTPLAPVTSSATNAEASAIDPTDTTPATANQQAAAKPHNAAASTAQPDPQTPSQDDATAQPASSAAPQDVATRFTQTSVHAGTAPDPDSGAIEDSQPASEAIPSDQAPATPPAPSIAAIPQAAAPAQGQAAAPGPATTQIAPILTSVHVPLGSTKDITIQLQPGSLGGVQVRIARGPDGAATITLQADRADTLHALQLDAGHLHQALDRAGLPTEGRSLSFQLGHGTEQGTATAGSGGFNPGPDNFSGGGANRQLGQPQSRTTTPAPQSTPSSQTEAAPSTARADGLNITA